MNHLFTPWKPFPPATHFTIKPRLVAHMKQIVPVVLALIPLVAVIGACVTCP